jgi:phosphatidylglycerophosphate synthase
MAFALEIVEVQELEFSILRRLLGLSVPLRLALTAQSAGAVAIVVGSEQLRTQLKDDRLRIPIVAARPSGAVTWKVPANWVVHRGYLAEVKRIRGVSAELDLTTDRVDFDPPYGFQPMAVTDQASKSQAARLLLRSLRKTQDGWTSTYLNRPISLFFTRALVATPLRPNQVSVGILAIGLAGAYLATRGDYLSLVVAAFCFHSQSVLDGCDGEMSRITFRTSKTGEWMDTIGDDLTNYGFFAGAGVGIYRATSNPLFLWAGLFVVLCGIITSSIQYSYLIKIGSGDLLKYPLGVGNAPGADFEKGAIAKFIDSISPLFKRDTFVFLTFLSALVGLLPVMLIIFAFGALSIVIATLKAEIRRKRNPE